MAQELGLKSIPLSKAIMPTLPSAIYSTKGERMKWAEEKGGRERLRKLRGLCQALLCWLGQKKFLSLSKASSIHSTLELHSRYMHGCGRRENSCTGCPWKWRKETATMHSAALKCRCGVEGGAVRRKRRERQSCGHGADLLATLRASNLVCV